MIARLSLPVVAVASALVLAGCGQVVTVDEAELEQEVSRQLEASVGQAPDDIDCPGDLKAEEGTEMRCTLTAGDDELGLTVTVTGVQGTNVDFDVQVDEQ